MSKKVVKRTVNLAKPPALTKKQKAELAALAARPDTEIDYSDIPSFDRGVLEECGSRPVLQAYQDVDDRADRFRCARLAPGPG